LVIISQSNVLEVSPSTRPVSGISLSDCYDQDGQYQDFLLDTDAENEQAPNEFLKEFKQIVNLVDNENVIPLFYDSTLRLYFSPERGPLPLTGQEKTASELLQKLYPTSRDKLSCTKNTCLPFISTPLELDDVDPVFYDKQINFLWKDDLLSSHIKASHDTIPIPPSSLSEVQSVLYDNHLKIFFLNEKKFDESAQAVILNGKVYHDPKVSYSKYLARQYPERLAQRSTQQERSTPEDLDTHRQEYPAEEEHVEVEQAELKPSAKKFVKTSKPAFRTGKSPHV
jgi:hypothetical protein